MPAKTSFKSRGKQHGFSLFELVLVVLLVGIFMTFAIDRMLRIQVDAESVSVQHIIGSLNSAISLQAAEIVVSKGLTSIRSLENTNPINYLQEIPYNYLGIKDDQQAGQYQTASWYYDPGQNILVYKIKNTSYFLTALAGTPRIRLKIEMIYEGKTSNGENKKIRGVSLTSMDDYSWKNN